MSDYSSLPNLLGDEVECFVFDSIPSTNDYLASLPFSNNPQVCITRQQTKGRGQYNRRWLSKKDSSILLSLRYVFPGDILLNGLSLVAGIAMVRVLEKHAIHDLKLKWPNDIYFKDKKMAGILVESSLQNDIQSVIIGLGINHNMGDFDCQTPWIDIQQILGKGLNKVGLSVDLISQLIDFCQLFARHGFNKFSTQWQALDYLCGKQISFEGGTGRCLGVNQQGCLLLETQDQVRAVCSSTCLSFR